MAGALNVVINNENDTVTVRTLPCAVCGEPSEFVLNATKFYNWQAGMYIQNAFPDMSIADRETLISGTHDKCFDILFPPPED